MSNVSLWILQLFRHQSTICHCGEKNIDKDEPPSLGPHPCSSYIGANRLWFHCDWVWLSWIWWLPTAPDFFSVSSSTESGDKVGKKSMKIMCSNDWFSGKVASASQVSSLSEQSSWLLFSPSWCSHIFKILMREKREIFQNWKSLRALMIINLLIDFKSVSCTCNLYPVQPGIGSALT